MCNYTKFQTNFELIIQLLFPSMCLLFTSDYSILCLNQFDTCLSYKLFKCFNFQHCIPIFNQNLNQQNLIEKRKSFCSNLIKGSLCLRFPCDLIDSGNKCNPRFNFLFTFAQTFFIKFLKSSEILCWLRYILLLQKLLFFTELLISLCKA